jgi:diaminopimelate epimerase
MEGLGNDFVVVDGPLGVTPELVAAVCDRRRGIGADGVLVVSTIGGDRVKMEYFNADGSAAEMCGNGLRCVASYAVTNDLVSVPSFVVETAVGDRRVSVDGVTIRAELGPIESSNADREIGGHLVRMVDVGNPHAVLFVEDPSSTAVEEIGPALEADDAFPDGTNVEFVRVHSQAAAVVAAAAASGRADVSAAVRLRGGTLDVEIIDGVAWITGPATAVFEGVWAG